MQRVKQALQGFNYQFAEVDHEASNLERLNQLQLPKLAYIASLNVDRNFLFSLSGVEQLRNLQKFSFRNNFIANPRQLLRVPNPFFMKEIAFNDNPMEFLVSFSGLKRIFKRLTLYNCCSPKRGHGKSQGEEGISGSGVEPVVLFEEQQLLEADVPE